MTSSLRVGSFGLALLGLLALGGCPSGDSSGGGLIPIDPANNAPTASLMATPESVAPGGLFALSATGSSDPDGDELSYEWSQLDGPDIELSGQSGGEISLSAPLAVNNAEMIFEVLVRDGRGGEARAQASVFILVADEFAGFAQSAASYRDTLSPDEAYHLLRRAALGASPQDVAAAVSRGLAATVDDLLTDKAEPDWLEPLAAQFEEDAQKRWLVYLLHTPNPLRERLTMFWHDRFAASRRVLESRDRNLAVLHRDMLRGWALGNYRGFLEALTLDPLMLIWLDGANSPKDSPNENYAREFWELFTLGRDVLYTEDDIREAARAFTGITLLREDDLDARPIYDLLNHDETNKAIFMGRAEPANHNYQSVIDLTLAQPEAAQYVARNLFVFFVHDHPSDALVTELAEQFVAGGFEIRPLVRTILMSQALFSSEARFNQVTSPVEHWAGVARTLNMHMYSEESSGYLFDRLTYDLAGAGQELLNPPGVQGWDEDEGWLEDQWILARVRALGEIMEYGPDHTADLPYHLLPPTDTWDQRETRDQIVDAIAGIFHLNLSAQDRDAYLLVLDQNGYLAFNLEDPERQPWHVFELLRLMAMHERVIGR